MNDFPKWLREEGVQWPMPVYRDLADLAAEQHEALLDFGDSKNCGDQNCKPCRAMKAAEAFKEKWK